MKRISDLSSFNDVREAGLSKLLPDRPRIAIGMGTCGTGNGAESVYHAFADAINTRGLGMNLARTGCFGFCAAEPLVSVPSQAVVTRDGKPVVFEVREGRALQRAIVTGPERQGNVVVTDGLGGSETLVARPPQSLKDGDRVRTK